MESSQNRLINKQTNTLMKMDGELTDMALKLDAMDKGVKTGFSRVDKDLEALDSHVNRRCKDHDFVLEKLKVAEGRVKVLEERSRTQCNMIEKLVARVEGMEDRLCCCQEGKGKGKAVEVPTSSVLGSPLVLEHSLAGSDGSYHALRSPRHLGCLLRHRVRTRRTLPSIPSWSRLKTRSWRIQPPSQSRFPNWTFKESLVFLRYVVNVLFGPKVLLTLGAEGVLPGG